MQQVGLSAYRRLIVLAWVVSALWYLGWRYTTITSDAVAFSWVVYASELLAATGLALHLYLSWSITSRTPPAARGGVKVEVLILADGQTADVVRRTLHAAQELDHDHTTCLIDLTRSDALQTLAQELGARYVTGDGTHAQGLNNALKDSKAEIVAILEADHAPRKDFLTRTLGYFEDDTVAFVQTPQDAYNLDSYEHWLQRKHGVIWSEESLAQKVVAPGRDRFNGAVLDESCGLVRRAAIDAIGGFVEGPSKESWRTSIRLHKKGFRSVYHNESLAFGLAPSDLGAFLYKRVVEARGGLSMWAREGILFSPGLTPGQRLSYLSCAIPAVDAWVRGVFYFLPGVILWTGVLPLAADGLTFFKHFIPFFLLGVWAYEESGRGYARWLLSELYAVARFQALAMTLFRRARANTRSLPSLTVPHCLLSALNLSGVAVGLLPLTDLHPPLPVLATGFCTTWGFAVFTMSAWVMSSVEKPRRRAEYRFPIPLPVRLERGEGQTDIVGTVDDVSSSGLKIYARFDQPVTVGTVLCGTVFVPGGKVCFTATVASLHHAAGGEYLKSVGCRVEWNTEEDRNRLESLLYGSDLQLHVMALSERSGTFLDRMSQVLEGRSEPPRSWRLWAPISYDTAEKTPGVGLISNGDPNGRDRHLLLFAPAPQESQMEVRMVTRTGETVIACRPAQATRIETALSPIYLYKVDSTGSPETSSEPAAAARL
ncbi:MAG: glycosyltransferase [Candidatus Xenobia bacterium]